VLRRLSALIAALSVLALAACGDDSDDGGKDGAAAKAQTCERVEAPVPKPDGGLKKPGLKLDPAKTWKVVFSTSCGDFTVQLDVKQAPNTTASFVSLARKGFYDETVFHRIVPGFVIQGGDPTGTGAGGPGYKTVDKPPSGAGYTQGVVSMAKTAAEPPGTSGSQFYVVSGADAGLPPDYAIIGKVVEGLDTVKRIEKQGDPNSGGAGTPLRPVVVKSATVQTS
jgi:peptidyl-prolyl cis-trans isomerase B (cyclophilin B)